MRLSASRFPVALGCIALLVVSAGAAWSAPGELLATRKYSSPTLATAGVNLVDSDEFGDHAVGLGDLDGPGPSVAAIAVAAIRDDDGGSARGAIHVFFLNASGDILSKQKISQTAGGFTGTLHDDDQFGTGLAWLGDLDGAGPSVGALAVGAINDDDGGANRGAVWILFLSSSGTVLSHTKISSVSGGFTGAIDNGDEFGGAVCGLGDLDGAGPGVMAMAVAANRDDDGGFDRGAVWICQLNASGTVISQTKINSDSMPGALRDTDSFGEKLVGLGDLDGPGPSVQAMVSSSVYDDDGGSDSGAAYICFLNSSGGLLSYQKISSTQGSTVQLPIASGDSFGAGLAMLGDLDGPGSSAATLAVGLSNADDGAGVDRGAILILFLDLTGNVLSYQFITSSTGGLAGLVDDTDEMGSSLGAAGDLNGAGAGIQTLLAGVPNDDDGGIDRGCVYLLTLDGTGTVSVGPPLAGPRVTGVALAGPNPFRSTTALAYRLSETGRVRLEVFDPTGRRVRQLVDRQDGPGDYRVAWNGLDDSGRTLATGCYLVRMTVDGRTVPGVAKAVLIR